MKIGFLCYHDIQLMDFIAPLEIANFWQKLNTEIEIINIAEDLEPILATNGVSICVGYNYVTCPKLDYLCIPGGVGRIKESKNQNTLNFIKQQYNNCHILMSVCTGAFLLAEAGLLSNKQATTYWRALKEFKYNYPNVILKEERIVKAGNIWTSGGVSSGIDLMFELVKVVAGESMAGQVQLLAEYFPNQHGYTQKSDAEKLPNYYSNNKSNFENKVLPEYILKQLLGV